MLYILIFSTIVKIISLLSIPIEQAYLTFIIMMETPLTLPRYNWNTRDAINTTLWSLSCLANVGIINETHVNITIEILSWLWLIVDSILENSEENHIPILFLCKISIFQYVFIYLPKLKDISMNCDVLYRNSRRLIMHQSL